MYGEAGSPFRIFILFEDLLAARDPDFAFGINKSRSGTTFNRKPKGTQA
jgi:hypothetical protein